MSDLLLRPPVDSAAGSTDSARPMESTIRGHQVNTMKRSLSWVDVFFIASGVPALVLFSIGALANQVGTPSNLVWTISVCMGFFQAFTYAEISGLFPNKSGGASVYGSVGWLPYSKFVAPLSVWCNWIAWTPILAIGTGLMAGYLLTSLFPADSAIMTWQYTLADLGFISDGLTLRLNSTFFLGAIFLTAIFIAQYFGISKAAKITMFLSLVGLLPLLACSLIPIFQGKVDFANFAPYVPVNGAWDFEGIGIFLGGMYVAAWTTYAFETCVCYTKEFKHPKKDAPKSLILSGLLCIFMFSIVPFVFEGVLGTEALSAPDIVDGTGVARAMGNMLGAGPAVTHIIVVMLLFSIILAVMTSMAGSSRTLYQASVDGWLPRYLSKVNKHGSPIYAMCTDLCFNLFLLMMSDYMVVLIASNCGYIIFNWLNLQSGWIHRIDRANVLRPFKIPKALLGFNVLLSFCNVAFLGVGAALLGTSNIITGLIICAMIIPVFIFRHYYQDHGVFPTSTAEAEEDGAAHKRCGILPYLAIGAAVCTAYGFYHLFS
ncbi:MAG: APC family permease [Selenomonadaceae bacterium]|nr:APC family permease [Selenomonadaceae bacterium]